MLSFRLKCSYLEPLFFSCVFYIFIGEKSCTTVSRAINLTMGVCTEITDYRSALPMKDLATLLLDSDKRSTVLAFSFAI